MSDPAVDLDELVQRGYRFALTLTHDEARADDLVQDAWHKILRVDGPWTIGYLFTTIRNSFIDHCRRTKRVAFESFGNQHDPHGEECGALADDDDVFQISNGTLEAALCRLRPEERAALYLAAVEDYTAQQIADLFGSPRGTILSLIHRAKGKLRENLRVRTGTTA